MIASLSKARLQLINLESADEIGNKVEIEATIQLNGRRRDEHIEKLFVYYNRIKSMVKNPFQKMTLLSIPATIGAATLEIRHLIVGQTEMTFILSWPVVIGFFVAMIACYISIKVMLKIVVAGKLRYFSYYLILLAVLILVDQNITHIVF